MLATQTKNFSYSIPRISHILQILGASLLLALFSQINIPLGFTPIPLTGQTFAVMLLGIFLGKNKASLAVIVYLLEGAVGLPFFAGGSWGFIHIIGPSGGYLLGFIVQAYLVGKFIGNASSYQGIRTLSFLMLSCLFQLGLGVLWLSVFIGFSSAVVMGLYPFLIGETIKSLTLALYLKKYHEKNSPLQR
jgi:biotin transport system substrate-specific component